MRLTTALATSLLISSAFGPAMAEGARSVSGSALYLARIALPPQAVLLVEARALDGRSLAHKVLPIAGAQVPLPFQLDLPLSQAASLSLAISIDGQTRWILDPVQIQPGADPVDLGEQVLHGFSGTGFDAAYLCGDTRLQSRRIGDALLLDTRTRSADGVYQLAATVPAGAAAASGSTEFVSDSTGLRAALSDLDMVVSQEGVDWPLCSPVPPIEPGSWRAAGRDAAWQAWSENGQIHLSLPTSKAASLTLRPPQIRDGGLSHALAEAGDHLWVGEGLCHDAAGLAFPQSVTLLRGGQELPGCGGDPAELLTEADWQVESIRGAPVLASAPPSLLFLPEGGVAGTTGCNRFAGSYQLGEHGLSFAQMAGTMMACSEPQMKQEAEFHKALAEVTGFDILDDGSLSLRLGETELLRARK